MCKDVAVLAICSKFLMCKDVMIVGDVSQVLVGVKDLVFAKHIDDP